MSNHHKKNANAFCYIKSMISLSLPKAKFDSFLKEKFFIFRINYCVSNSVGQSYPD